jgi:hypothetical protein
MPIVRGEVPFTEQQVGVLESTTTNTLPCEWCGVMMTAHLQRPRFGRGAGRGSP